MGLGAILPVALRIQVPDDFENHLEEIRIRVGQPAELIYEDLAVRHYMTVTEDDITEMLNYLSDYSLYALEQDMKLGYFTVKGGHRVGIVGRTSRQAGRIVDIGALNVRVAHEKKGCAKKIVDAIRKGNSICNTILFSAPGVGKTTYLRDCIRLLSSGDAFHPGMKVGVVDERSELAACVHGVAQNDLGPRTDVLDGCPKPKGIQMLLRTMSPQVIAVDELGGAEDFLAVDQALYCGCRLIGSVHAQGIDEMKSKQSLMRLLANGQVERLVELDRGEDGKRSVKVYDGSFARLC